MRYFARTSEVNEDFVVGAMSEIYLPLSHIRGIIIDTVNAILVTSTLVYPHPTKNPD